MVDRAKVRDLTDALKRGELSRRAFLTRAVALGVAVPAMGLQPWLAAAQDATPAAGVLITAPDSGTEGQTRGAGGELKILQWQAPTTLNMHLAGSFKDQLAACLVTEPLIHFLPDGTPIPCLATEVPSQENGLVADDLTTVTYNLQDGLALERWRAVHRRRRRLHLAMDHRPGQPVGQRRRSMTPIADVEAVDDLTVKITFKEPQLGWYSYFSSAQSGGILPRARPRGGRRCQRRISRQADRHRPVCGRRRSRRTTTSTTSINPNYREPNKPFFATVNLKGGGDAASAARAVLQTGDWDFAWNLQVDPSVAQAIWPKTGRATWSSSRAPRSSS